jgi:glutathione S-transferase
MTDFTLYAETLWASPYAFSSLVALREKGADFELALVDLAHGAHRQGDYASASITGRIPSLDHRGFRLAESSAIAEYLEEVLPPPKFPRLFPEGARERARARQVMAWLRSDLGALRDERSTMVMFYYRSNPRPLSAAAARDVEKLARVGEQLVPAGGGPLFGGWSLADAELAFMLHRLILCGDPLPERLASYARTQWERPSVREFVDHARPPAVPDSYWAISGTPKPVP